MASRLDRVLVIDVESTCWEAAPPPGEESEIIEIGICVLDVASADRIARDSIFVRPERSRVGDFCARLTTLTQAEVESGLSFADACGVLKKRFLAKDRLFASWGDYDRRQFERQCHARGVAYPFGPTHLNVKNLFALVHGLEHEVGIDEALARVGLPLEGTHHRGGDDAWNIARLLSRLLSAARSGLRPSTP